MLPETSGVISVVSSSSLFMNFSRRIADTLAWKKKHFYLIKPETSLRLKTFIISTYIT